MTNYKPIAETNNFIVLDKYCKEWQAVDSYQSEGDLERELIQDLVNQGYEYLPALNNAQAMLVNVREQLHVLNAVQFLDGDWLLFVENYLDKTRLDLLPVYFCGNYSTPIVTSPFCGF